MIPISCDALMRELRRFFPDERLVTDPLRRLAWGIWTLDEIRSGEPFARLLAQ